MGLSNNTIKKFAVVVLGDDATTPPSNGNQSAYATVIDGDYISIDGSATTTPYVSTVSVNDGDRVIVEINNHTAVVTGNTTSPSCDEKAVQNIFKSTITEGLDESTIEQIASKIELKVVSEEKYKSDLAITARALGVTVTDDTSEAYLLATAKAINSKVSTDTYESYVLQTNNSISSKVSSNELQGKVESIIEQFASKIELKVVSEEKYKSDLAITARALGVTVTDDTSEAYLLATAKAINSKVSTDTYESYVLQTNNSISSKVSSNELQGKVESIIEQLPDSIKLAAKNIKLEGIITANGDFRINELGSMIANNASVTGLLHASNFRSNKGATDENDTYFVINNVINGYRNKIAEESETRNFIRFSEADTSSLGASRPDATKRFIVWSDQMRFVREDNGTTCRAQISFNGTNQLRIDGINGTAPANQQRIETYVNGDFKVAGYIYDHTGSVVTGSDKNLKNSIRELDSEKSAEFIYNLNPVEYKYNEGTSNRYHHGFIAQDVKEVMGDDDWGVYVEDNEQTKGLRYEELIADIVKVVQTQKEEIERLKLQVSALMEERNA